MAIAEKRNILAKFPNRLDVYRASGYSFSVTPFDIGEPLNPVMDLDNGDWQQYQIKKGTTLTFKNLRIGEYKLFVTHGKGDAVLTFPKAYFEDVVGETAHAHKLTGSSWSTKSIFTIQFDGTSLYISVKKFGV